MRKLLIGTMSVLAILLGAPGVAAAADPRPTPVNNEPFDLPPLFCGFSIHVGIVLDNEVHTIIKHGDGTVVEEITGALILSFTNTSPVGGTPGKSIVRDVGGSTMTTSRLDGRGRFEGTGRNWLAFGPGGRTNTGEPGLVFTDGKVEVRSEPNAAGVPTATRFTLDGHQVNGCDLLR
jgi:hypothetical protein